MLSMMILLKVCFLTCMPAGQLTEIVKSREYASFDCARLDTIAMLEPVVPTVNHLVPVHVANNSIIRSWVNLLVGGVF